MHRINHSEVELHTGDAALARALLDRIGRIYGPRIAPVVDRVCSELSASEAPVRIDRLEVDLGTCAADDLENAFVAQLESRLRGALHEALRRKPGGGRGARDSLELLETFAFTGGLPWWAQPDREVVARHFARASAEAREDLVALLGRIAQDHGALERITRLCGRKALAALVERAQTEQLPVGPRVLDDAARRRQWVEPAALDQPHAGVRDIGHHDPMTSPNLPGVDDATAVADSAVSPRTGDELRRQQRGDPTSLGTQQTGAREVGDREPASHAPAVDDPAAAASSAASRVIDGEPRHRQQSRPTVLDQPQPDVRDIGHHGPVSASNFSAVGDATAEAGSAVSPRTGDELRRQQRGDPISLGTQQTGAREAGDREPASHAPAADDAAAGASCAAAPLTDDHPRRSQPAGMPPSDIRSVSDATAAVSPAASPRIEGEQPPAPRAASPPPAPQRSFAPPRLDSGPEARAAARASRALPAPTDPAELGARRRAALVRLDELYVDDAGLVILWPFLERLFVRAGVLGEGRRFLDEAAQLQAVALVDSLATADPAPLEFRLPLAKLLCGRSLESDFALERPLVPEQLAEGDRLLAAVIDRVPALGEPSIAEFRDGFLARPGALGARDGAWLLQVERRSYDAVLDRFPWTWSWVRLPWMPGPLRVEW